MKKRSRPNNERWERWKFDNQQRRNNYTRQCMLAHGPIGILEGGYQWIINVKGEFWDCRRGHILYSSVATKYVALVNQIHLVWASKFHSQQGARPGAEVNRVVPKLLDSLLLQDSKQLLYWCIMSKLKCGAKVNEHFGLLIHDGVTSQIVQLGWHTSQLSFKKPPRRD